MPSFETATTPIPPDGVDIQANIGYDPESWAVNAHQWWVLPAL